MKQIRELAVVTGASSGLGISLTWELARRGYDLVITARSEQPMQELAEQVNKQTGATVHIQALDLAQQGSAAELVKRLDARGLNPAVLVNNAGIGLAERFVEHDPERLRLMLQLNMVSLTELTHILGTRMAARGSGHILLVSSLAAYAPSPMQAAYAASKAYVLSLGEALNAEMAPKVGVTVLSPGLMDTGFNAASGYETPDTLTRLVRPTAMVAKIGIDALFSGKHSVVAGRINRILAIMSSLLPRRFILNQARQTAEGQN